MRYSYSADKNYKKDCSDVKQHNQLVYVKFIHHFNVAKKVPVSGGITYEELAASTGVDRDALCRVLRFGIAFRIFQEPQPGTIAHSAASRLIAEEEAVADWVGANVDDMWPSAQRLVDALTKWPAADEPDQTVGDAPL